MMRRPNYCPDLQEDEDCPECGATIQGNDSVGGVCQARYSGSKPEPLVRIILVDRRTGHPV